MKKLLPVINIIVGLLLISFIGIKHHPEFSDKMVIVKHRPSLHFVFESPIGDSEKTMEDLTPAEQEQERLYRQYIKRPNTRLVDNMALVFFQVGLFLILSSLMRFIFFRRKYKPSLRRIFTINALSLALLLAMYQMFWSGSLELWVAVVIQFVFNLIVIFPLLRKNK